MSDYIFKYTTQSVASFVVKPYTANGPASPASATPYVSSISGIHAFSINTPFVLVGKGVTDYGQTVQNNILYLAENFCNKTRPQPPMTGMVWYKSEAGADVANPTDPTVAGMYVWDGSAWNNLLINEKIVSNVNLSGHQLTNIGDAVTDTDALSASAANTRYLQLSGGTLSGNLTMSPTSTVIVSHTPVTNFDVTNKIYVDTANLMVQNNIDSLQANVGVSVGDINTTLTTLYPRAGGTITGNVSIDGNLTVGGTGNVTFGNGTGTIDCSNRAVSNVATPVLALDAANKAYVDDTVADAVSNISTTPSATADGVVSSATFNETTGVLTLTRTQGLPALVTNGLFAERSHIHSSGVISYDPAANQQYSVMSGGGIVISTVQQAIVRLDQAISNRSINPTRTVIEQTVIGNTSFSFADQYTYEVWSDRLMVFVDGIKQYCDTRAESYVSLDGGVGFSVVGLAAGTYPLSLTVDGITYDVLVDVMAADTYANLYAAIVAALDVGGVPVTCVYQQFDSDSTMTFVHNESGAGHSVTLHTNVGDLFQVISGAQLPVGEIGATYRYRELGGAGEPSVDIEFHVAPPVGALLEIVVLV